MLLPFKQDAILQIFFAILNVLQLKPDQVFHNCDPYTTVKPKPNVLTFEFNFLEHSISCFYTNKKVKYM